MLQIPQQLDSSSRGDVRGLATFCESAGASSTSGWFGGWGGCLNSKTGDALGCYWSPWAYGIARHLRAGCSMLHIGDADVHFFFTRAAEARNAPCSEADCKGTLPGGVSGSLMRQTKGHTQRQARCLRLSTAPSLMTAIQLYGPPCPNSHNLAILAQNTDIFHAVFCMKAQVE